MKNINDELNTLINIANEGDLTYRFANHLHQQGWHESDFLQELPKLGHLSSAFTLSVSNRLRDIDKDFNTQKSVYGDVAGDLKRCLKALKKNHVQL